MAFTFYVLLPSALPFLGGFTAISQNWTAGEYFGFITGLMIWIGVFFEFPLVIYILTSVGLVKPPVLLKQWRLAIVIIAIMAAAVTPTVDPVNMALVMVPLVRDHTLQNYVNRVGNWVALQSGRQEVTWHFGVLDTEAINAFAAPGGYIFVTKGLYRLLNNEAELAGVLGHEIAHVTQKHHLKVLKQSSLIGALGQAASSKAKGSDQMVQNLIGNGAEIMARGLDKNAEHEADRVGMVYAARAGYDPWGLPSVLQDMAALPAGDNRTSLLYKTHPHPADRLAALGEAVDGRLDAVRGKELADRFYRIR